MGAVHRIVVILNKDINMSKVAKLVTVSLMARVIVDDAASESDILEAARPNLIDKFRAELGENLESIEDDTECPYGTFDEDGGENAPNSLKTRIIKH
jgi:hypothetical protein